MAVPVRDHEAHNRENEALWTAFHRGEARRAPLLFSVNARYLMNDRARNEGRDTMAAMFYDTDMMLRWQLRLQRFLRCELCDDRPWGPPPEGWRVNVDMQNVAEPAWYGCPIDMSDPMMPYAQHFLRAEDLPSFLRRPPDPFGGVMAQVMEHRRTMLRRKEQGMELEGCPIGEVGGGPHTDGPMTVACSLMGPSAFCLLLYEDPQAASDLLAFLADTAVARIHAWRRELGQPERTPMTGLADDSIALISHADYIRFVLPHHRRLIAGLATGERKNNVHLCGDSTRHFLTIRDELNAGTFDTGYPIDHAAMARALGPDVVLQGGPTVGFLLSATPDEAREESLRILRSVAPHTRRFLLKEANNLAPGTPLPVLNAMYDAVRDPASYGWTGGRGAEAI